jgi:hypothetical protein
LHQSHPEHSFQLLQWHRHISPCFSPTSSVSFN